MTIDSLVSVQEISKNFARCKAVDGISFSVGRGEILGFLGPNGAGKTTTMRMITGYLPHDSGSISVCGSDINTDSLAARKKIGYLPEGGPVYEDMTPQTFLEFIGETRGLRGANLKTRMDFVIEKLHLGAVLKQNIDTLSKGFKRRVALAQAIIHDPEVLILDEPTDGLDPNQKHEVRELIKSMSRDKVIIISTHILEEVEAICTRSIIIAGGKLVASGSIDEIIRKANLNNAIVIKFQHELTEGISAELLKVANVESVRPEGKGGLLVFARKCQDIIGDISDTLHRQQCQVQEIYIRKATLDEAFRRLTA